MTRTATSFNQRLNNWNVSSVKNMCNMFYKAISFNQPLNEWNVSNVRNMYSARGRGSGRWGLVLQVMEIFTTCFVFHTCRLDFMSLIIKFGRLRAGRHQNGVKMDITISSSGARFQQTAASQPPVPQQQTKKTSIWSFQLYLFAISPSRSFHTILNNLRPR